MKNKIFLLLLIFILLIGIIFPAEEGDEIDIIGENFENIGSLIGEGLEILAKGGVRVTKEEGISTLEFYGEEASLNIGGNIYENIDTSGNNPAYIKLNELGEVLSADLTARDDTVFSFGKDKFGTEKIFGLFKGQRAKHEEGITTIIGKQGDFFGYGEKGSGIFKKIGFLGETINVKRISETTSLFSGKFNIESGDEVYGASILENGEKILQIKSGTNALIGKIKHEASRDLNFYYEKNFDIWSHEGENYFNYGDNKISFGGIGYTSDLGKENNIFGNMKTQVQDGYLTKTRNLKITMNGGDMEISKYIDSDTSDLGFNIRHKGDFVIENGRAFIYSQDKLYLKEKGIFVKYYYDEDGLLDCYDLNLNQGGYTIEDRIFTDTTKDVIVNMNTPWENDVLEASKLSRESSLVKEIENQATLETGLRPRYLIGYMDEKGEEAMLKWTYEAAEIANKNIYGVKVSPEELWTMYMMEGGSYWEEGYPYYDYRNIGIDADVSGSHIGLDFIKEQQSELEAGNFLPSGFLSQFSRENAPENEYGQQMNTLVFDNPKQSLIAFAGEIARRKYHFQQDFISAFGEDEFKSLTDEEAYYWVRRYFNTGEVAGKAYLTGTKYNTYNYKEEPITVQGAGRENTYVPWNINRKEPTDSRESAHYNSMVATSTYIFMRALGLFSFP